MPFTGPVEDRLAIRELLDTYSHAVCTRDADLWGSLWAEDSVWLMPDYPEFAETHGRTAIVEMWKGAMAHYPGILFVTTPGAIEVNGDTAKVVAYTSEVYDQDGDTKRDRGVYHDECIKRDGQWRFKSRQFRNVHRQSGAKGL